jgi:hypothetical protein
MNGKKLCKGLHKYAPRLLLKNMLYLCDHKILLQALRSTPVLDLEGLENLSENHRQLRMTPNRNPSSNKSPRLITGNPKEASFT